MLDRICTALQGNSRCIVIYGPPGVGKTTLLHKAVALCFDTNRKQNCDAHPSHNDSECKYSVKLFDPFALVGFIDGVDNDRAFRHWAENSLKDREEIDNLKTFLAIDDAHLWFSKGSNRLIGEESQKQHFYLVLTLADLISSLNDQEVNTKVVLIVENMSDLHPFISRYVEEWISVEIPLSNERMRVWNETVGALGNGKSVVPEAVISELNKQCHGWVLSDIVEVCCRTNFDDNEIDVVDSLRTAVDNHKPLLFGLDGDASCPWTLISSHQVSTTWDSIGGLEDTKQALKEVVVWPLVYTDEIEALGLKQAPSGVLLFGPPGTGKTLLASAVAKESDANFMVVSVGDIIRGHVGESENLLARVFSMARSVVPCVLFFDEFQALFGRRDSSGEVSRKLISQFLLETDRTTPGLFLLAATNMPEEIDSALLRPGRFDRKVYVPPPNIEGRRVILEKIRDVMGSWNHKICIADLVEQTDGFTGAEIEALCSRAALLAIEQANNVISAQDFSCVISDYSQSLT